MSDYQFFKPTPLYKEFIILDLIEKEKNITQRIMSNHLNVSVSMINLYLDKFEKNEYIKREYINSKNVNYEITKKGIERKKVLNIWYLKSSQEIYISAKNNIVSFLRQIVKRGYSKILLYGAGEVAEIILDVIQGDRDMPLEVLAVIDDDITKVGTTIVNSRIISCKQISGYEYDGILVSSYTHHENIKKRLINFNYSFDKILEFFN